MLNTEQSFLNVWKRLTPYLKFGRTVILHIIGFSGLSSLEKDFLRLLSWFDGGGISRAKLETFPHPSPKIDFKKGLENKEKDD